MLWNKPLTLTVGWLLLGASASAASPLTTPSTPAWDLQGSSQQIMRRMDRRSAQSDPKLRRLESEQREELRRSQLRNFTAPWSPNNPGGSPGGPDTPSSWGPAAALGDGSFLLNFDQLYSPLGNSMKGVSLAGTTQPVMDVFQQSGLIGGLMRIHLRMDFPGRAEAARKRFEIAKRMGMKTLLTVVGTPKKLASTQEGPDLPIGMPVFARSVPSDMNAWANEIVELVGTLHSDHGLLPDYIEIWNEPDRAEWWSGTAQDYLDLYATTASALDASFGWLGLKVGGPGLANSRSRLDGYDSLLVQIAQAASNQNLPLDFLSWHHYGLASGLRYDNTTYELNHKLDAMGLQNIELIVSEWNIYPSPNWNPNSIEFDGSHSAAQYAGFLASASATGLSRQTFFMATDMTLHDGISDLTGKGMGMLSRHGIKKPVFRVFELMNPMMQEQRVEVQYPNSEYALSILASRLGDRVRLAISNDVVEPGWLWARAVTERGALPGVLGAALQQVGYRRNRLPSRNQLMAAGLSEFEADVVLDVLPMVIQAEDLKVHPRQVSLQIGDTTQFSVSSVWRFDSQHNNPAARRAEILPSLQTVMQGAYDDAWQAAVDVLVGNGQPEPNRNALPKLRSSAAVAAHLGVSQNLANKVWNAYWDGLDLGRVSKVDMINALPATRLQVESASQAGIQVGAGTLSFIMEPDSVVIMDLQL